MTENLNAINLLHNLLYFTLICASVQNLYKISQNNDTESTQSSFLLHTAVYFELHS